MKKYTSKFKAAVFCLLVYIAAASLYITYKGMEPFINTVPYVFLITCVSAMVISLWFNKSRVFFNLLGVFLGNAGIFYCVDIAGSIEAAGELASFMAFAVLVNLFIFSLTKERGVLSIYGFGKFGLIFIEVYYILWWTKVQNESFKSYFSWVFSDRKDGMFEFIPEPIIIVAFIMFCTFVFLAFYRNNISDIYFAAVIPAVVFGIGNIRYSDVRIMFFIITSFILLIAVFHESYNMAFIDELTTIPGRRALKNELLKLSGKHSIAMLDIDFFKKFNDTYGHEVGDQVLKMVAEVMKEVTGGGKVFRYGGEEFTIVFPGKGIGEAIPHLEQLRENIAKKGLVRKGTNKTSSKKKKSRSASGVKMLYVNVSIGVAERNDKYRKPDEVMKAADSALYRAKKKGRNCVSK